MKTEYTDGDSGAVMSTGQRRLATRFIFLTSVADRLQPCVLGLELFTESHNSRLDAAVLHKFFLFLLRLLSAKDLQEFHPGVRRPRRAQKEEQNYAHAKTVFPRIDRRSRRRIIARAVFGSGRRDASRILRTTHTVRRQRH